MCSSDLREMTALLSRVPKAAIRHGHDGLEEVPIEMLVAGDRILIRQGEVVPVDGIVGAGSATLDQSALTGESVPTLRKAGADVPSGSTNIGAAFDLVATRASSESTYAGIVRLVEAAQQAAEVGGTIGTFGLSQAGTCAGRSPT